MLPPANFNLMKAVLKNGFIVYGELANRFVKLGLATSVDNKELKEDVKSSEKIKPKRNIQNLKYQKRK
jgi:hypothetical protein